MADDLNESPSTEAADHLNDTSAYQQCFACGQRNPSGLQLVFREESGEVVCEFTPDARFQGFPGVVHGGILATLLDETLNRQATREGRWMMTARLDIRYRSAAPVGQTLRVVARTVSSRSRALTAEGEIRLVDDPQTIVATAEGTFLPVPLDYQRRAVERSPELDGFFNI